jgi:thymidine phosphorylase
MFLPQTILRRKRDGEELSAVELTEFVRGIMNGAVGEGQIAAFTMATFLRGMTVAESTALTLAMRDSGTVIDWKEIVGAGRRVIEKHSSGGVGDEKVTLMVTPLVAACGVVSPNISGRSLGHTGGELDLLEAIPGYTIEPSRELFEKVVASVGTAIIGPTADLAPADRAIFHVRDVTATVESIPLIVSSILSKKLASGAQGLVMTVPFGSGAFMATEADARELADALLAVAASAGLPMVALISDLEEVLGNSVGNALQIHEVINFLRGREQDAKLKKVVVTIAAEIVALAAVAPDREAARTLVEEKLDDGSGARKFAQMVRGLGGPADLVDLPGNYLAQAAVILPVYSERSGIVQSMDCYRIGMALNTLGAGRAQPFDAIDYAVGISRVAHVGDAVGVEIGAERPLCWLHAQSPEQWEIAAREIRNAVRVKPTAITPPPVIRQRLETGAI